MKKGSMIRYVALELPRGTTRIILWYMIVTLELISFSHISKTEIHSIIWSDQQPVTIKIMNDSRTSHKPLWRNNTLLLSHPHIREEEIEEKLKEYFRTIV